MHGEIVATLNEGVASIEEGLLKRLMSRSTGRSPTPNTGFSRHGFQLWEVWWVAVDSNQKPPGALYFLRVYGQLPSGSSNPASPTTPVLFEHLHRGLASHSTRNMLNRPEFLGDFPVWFSRYG